jgi:hypothetical protein
MKKHYRTASTGQGNIRWRKGDAAPIKPIRDPRTCDLSQKPRLQLIRLIQELRRQITDLEASR